MYSTKVQIRILPIIAVLALSLTCHAQLPDDFPAISVSKTGETGEGYAFLTVSTEVEGVGYYVMMLNDSGKVYKYRKLENDYAYDFKVQPNGLLSYAQFLSHHSYTGGGDGIHMILDENMAVVDSFQAVHGYIAEAHDFQWLPNGHVLLFGYYLTQMDLSKLVDGGYPNALVSGGIVQELDADKNCVWQWRSWDYYDKDHYDFGTRSTGQYVSEFHLNTINLDWDGNLLLATPSWTKKIDRQTGEILWHLGGDENEFSFIGVDSIDGVGDVTGHAFHRLKNGNYLIYDNGPRRGSGTSEAHEFRLDQVNKIAEKIQTFTPDDPIRGWHRGNAQRLPNGNTLVGWGGANGDSIPTATEFDPEGNTVFEIFFENPDVESYRVVRHPYPPVPFLEGSHENITAGNNYDFTQGDSIDMGINIAVETRDGAGYSEMVLTHFKYAPLWPQFPERAPMVLPERFLVDGLNLGNMNGEISFDIEILGIENPDSITVFHRPYPHQPGLFLPLTTEYNDVTKTIKASFESISGGEFILTYPDLPHKIFTSRLIHPEDSALVNENYPVHLEWSPRGFFDEFHLQVATDTAFYSIEIDEAGYKKTIYDFNAEPTTYYWRVKTINEAGESNWSDILEFTVGDPFISITAPETTDEWQRGLEYFITWDENVVSDVRLELYKAGEMISVIDTPIYRNAYLWEVPLDLDPSDDYNILIRSIEEETVFDSLEAPFTIIDTSGTGIILPITSDLPIHIYPNPADDYLQIDVADREQDLLQLMLFDALGRQIYFREFKNNIRISLYNFDPGLYYIRILDYGSSRSAVKKFFKTE